MGTIVRGVLLLGFFSFCSMSDPSLAEGITSAPGLHKQKSAQTGLRGQRRVYRYFIPSSYDKENLYPLVIALHGGISKGKNIRLRSGLDKIAEREGFIAAYPEGNGIFGLLQHWNAGSCCGKALKEGIDDAGFVISMIDDLAKHLSIDKKRVYVFGFSNGGMLSYQLAADYPEHIAAFAAVSGTFGGINQKGETVWHLEPPDIPVPTIIIHGTLDKRLPIEGSPANDKNDWGMIPVIQSASFWADANQCGQSTKTNSGYINVHLTLWKNCRGGSEVQLYRLDNWGHAWAGAAPETKNDHSIVGEFETAEVMWAFFKRFKRHD